jgi:enoyl-CoA hydratase
LGLTGYEMMGSECVRLGLASDLTQAARLSEIKEMLEHDPDSLPFSKSEAVAQLRSFLSPCFDGSVPSKPEMDAWVETHFTGKTSPQEILSSLSHCRLKGRLCEDVYRRLSERSPTALVLTLGLLRHNEGRPLEEVFAVEARAAHYIISHPDFLEGVRARIIDKHDHPRWHPATIEEVVGIDRLFGEI